MLLNKFKIILPKRNIFEVERHEKGSNANTLCVIRKFVFKQTERKIKCIIKCYWFVLKEKVSKGQNTTL